LNCNYLSVGISLKPEVHIIKELRPPSICQKKPIFHSPSTSLDLHPQFRGERW